ncbi:MAG: hypothetical protein RIK87_11500 [Fuerstiella sp.]
MLNNSAMSKAQLSSTVVAENPGIVNQKRPNLSPAPENPSAWKRSDKNRLVGRLSLREKALFRGAKGDNC